MTVQAAKLPAVPAPKNTGVSYQSDWMVPSPAVKGLIEVPDEVPQEGPGVQRGPGQITYWLWYGRECVSTVLMPPGTGAADVRQEALKDGFISCDRARGETPDEREAKIRHSVVRIFDVQAAQERKRRELPFEDRTLFPGESPFLELTFRSLDREAVAGVHVRDITVGLQDLALAEGLELSASPCEGAQRSLHIESADRQALGRVEHALKRYLAEREAELVSEFGVGYVRHDPVHADGEAEPETETETERPRG